MTVEELIAALSEMPATALVLLDEDTFEIEWTPAVVHRERDVVLIRLDPVRPESEAAPDTAAR